jgi:hypothetical protein
MECRVPDLFGDPVWTLARGAGRGLANSATREK